MKHYDKHNFQQTIEYSKEFSNGKINLRTGNNNKTVFFRRKDIDTEQSHISYIEDDNNIFNDELFNTIESGDTIIEYI